MSDFGWTASVGQGSVVGDNRRYRDYARTDLNQDQRAWSISFMKFRFALWTARTDSR